MTDPEPTKPTADGPADDQAPKSAAAKLFDIRLMIGALFLLYGVLLTIYSFFDSAEERAKAAGIHVNLWLGLSMLVVGLIFGLWVRLQPTKRPDPCDVDTDRPAQH